MNEKAFNLFTALISLLLIVITSMLVLAMIQTESNTNSLVNEITTQTRLEAVLRLMRADVLQLFNYKMRDEIEWWLSKNPVPFSSLEVWNDWDAIVKDFAYGQFASEGKFASRLADSLWGMILGKYGKGLVYEGRYEIKITGNDQKFKEIITELSNVSTMHKDFIQVVGCDGAPANCPIGTFYVNLKLSELSDKEYEALPIIQVKDLVENKELRDAILPRNDVKMYVPLRLFKALAYVRAFMHSDLANPNSASDYGYLSPRIHNEIDSMALGMCDYKRCHPRDNPYFPPEKNILFGKACPGAPSNYIESMEVSFRGRSLGNYNPSNKNSIKSMLAKAVKLRLCELSKEILASLSEPDFKPEKQVFEGEDCYILIDKIKIEVKTTASVRVKIQPEAVGSPHTATTTTWGAEPNMPSACPFNFNLEQNRRIGYYLQGSEIKWPDLEAAVCNGFTGLSDIAALKRCEKAGWGCCGEVSGVGNMVLSFIEENPHYKVNKNREVKFMVKITDYSFTPFNPNYDSGAPLSNCALQHAPIEQSCNPIGWTCLTAEKGATYNDCYLEHI